MPLIQSNDLAQRQKGSNHFNEPSIPIGPNQVPDLIKLTDQRDFYKSSTWFPTEFDFHQKPTFGKYQPITLIKMMIFVANWFKFEENKNSSCEILGDEITNCRTLDGDTLVGQLRESILLVN